MLSAILIHYVTLLFFQLADFGSNLLGVGVFGSTATLYLQGGYFEGTAELKPLLYTWSLAVEEQFYDGFSRLAFLNWKLKRRWIGVSIIALLALMTLTLGQWGAQKSRSANFYLRPTRACELGAGALVAMASLENTKSENRVAEIFSALGIVGMLA